MRKSGNGRTYWYVREKERVSIDSKFCIQTLTFRSPDSSHRFIAELSFARILLGLSREPARFVSHFGSYVGDFTLKSTSLHFEKADATASSATISQKRHSMKHVPSSDAASVTVHLTTASISLPFYHFLLPPYETQRRCLPVFQALWASMPSCQVRVFYIGRDGTSPSLTTTHPP